MKSINVLLFCLLVPSSNFVQSNENKPYSAIPGYQVTTLQKMSNGICPQGMDTAATAATVLTGVSLLGALKHSQIYTPSFTYSLGAAVTAYVAYKVHSRLSAHTVPMLLKQKGELREVFEKVIGQCRSAKEVVKHMQLECIKQGNDEYSLVKTKLFLEALMKAALNLNKKLVVLGELPLPEKHITLLADAVRIIINQPEYRVLAQYEKQTQWQTIAKQFAWTATKTGVKGIFNTGLFLTKTVTKALIKSVVKNSVTITDALKSIIA